MKQLLLFLFLAIAINQIYSQESHLPLFFYTKEFQEIIKQKKVKEVQTVYLLRDVSHDGDYRKEIIQDFAIYRMNSNGFVDHLYVGEMDIRSVPSLFSRQDSMMYSGLMTKFNKPDSILYEFKKRYKPPGKLIGYSVNFPYHDEQYKKYSVSNLAMDTSMVVFCECRNLWNDSIHDNIIHYELEIRKEVDFKMNHPEKAHWLYQHWGADEGSNIPLHSADLEFLKVNDTLQKLHRKWTDGKLEEISGMNLYKSETKDRITDISKRLSFQKSDSIVKDQVMTFISKRSIDSIYFEKTEYYDTNNTEKVNKISSFQKFLFKEVSRNKITEYYLYNIWKNNHSASKKYSSFDLIPNTINSVTSLCFYKKEIHMNLKGDYKYCKYYKYNSVGRWVLIGTEKYKNGKVVQIDVFKSGGLYSPITTMLEIYYQWNTYPIFFTMNENVLWDWYSIDQLDLFWLFSEGRYTLRYVDDLLTTVINEEDGNIYISISDEGINVDKNHSGFKFIYESSEPSKE